METPTKPLNLEIFAAFVSHLREIAKGLGMDFRERVTNDTLLINSTGSFSDAIELIQALEDGLGHQHFLNVDYDGIYRVKLGELHASYLSPEKIAQQAAQG